MSLAEGDDHQPREYEDVRAATQQAEGQEEEPPPKEEPKAEDPPEEKPKEEPKAPEPKARKKGRPKKGEELCGRWTCAECGGNFSVRTKKHACTKPRGADSGTDLPVPPIPGAPVTREPPRAETPPEPVVTFDMCRKFLYGEIKARRDARRERISVSMF